MYGVEHTSVRRINLMQYVCKLAKVTPGQPVNFSDMWVHAPQHSGIRTNSHADVVVAGLS